MYVLPLICTFLNFFLLCHNFLSTGLLHSWLGLFLVFIILFVVIVNVIVFLISLPVSLLFACRNATDSWILILYHATLLNSFITLLLSWWNLWSSLCTVSCHLQVMTVLFLPFQFGCLLFLLV